MALPIARPGARCPQDQSWSGPCLSTFVANSGAETPEMNTKSGCGLSPSHAATLSVYVRPEWYGPRLGLDFQAARGCQHVLLARLLGITFKASVQASTL
jgi:hypothetical protein